MAELIDIVEIFAELAPVLIPFIPMYILSRKISEKQVSDLMVLCL